MSLKLKKKILYLIGGSGKIGSDIADKFLKSGFKVVILDKIQSKKVYNVGKTALYPKQKIVIICVYSLCGDNISSAYYYANDQ